MLGLSSAAPLAASSTWPASASQPLTVGQAAALQGLPQAAAGVVNTLARRFGTDPGTILQGLSTLKARTGFTWGRLAQMALTRPVVAAGDYFAAIRRYGAEVSYILRHPGQDLSDLSVSGATGGRPLPMTL